MIFVILDSNNVILDSTVASRALNEALTATEAETEAGQEWQQAPPVRSLATSLHY